MLSEPLSVTYDGVAKSLVRVSSGDPTGRKPNFVTQDGEFRIFIFETLLEDTVRFEVRLERVRQDTDGDPFNGVWSSLPNGVGLVFEVNKLQYFTDTDLPLLQSALLSFVDATIRGRILGGEK